MMKATIQFTKRLTTPFFSDAKPTIPISVMRRSISTSHFDEGLSFLLNKALEQYRTGKLEQAINNFDGVINMLEELQPSQLVTNQKDILLNAYVGKARLLGMGSAKQAISAVELLEKALRVNPGFTQARELKLAIEAEYYGTLSNQLFPTQAVRIDPSLTGIKKLDKESLELIKDYKLQKHALDKKTSVLVQLIEKARHNCSMHQYQKAQQNFDVIINAFNGENLCELTKIQKQLLTEACIEKANILRCGGLEDTKDAMKLLEAVTAIDPNNRTAQELLSGLHAEFFGSLLPKI